MNYKDHFAPILLVFVVVAIALFGEAATNPLQYHRTSISNGELWRLLTGNLVHLSVPHLMLNLTSLALNWLLFWRYFSNRNWIFIVFLCSLSTGLGLYLFNPDLEWYVGFSGTLHGTFIAGSIAEIRKRMASGYFLFVVLVTKLIWEQFAGPLPGSEQAAGGNVIVDAHLYGGVCGLMAIFLPLNTHTRPPNH